MIMILEHEQVFLDYDDELEPDGDETAIAMLVQLGKQRLWHSLLMIYMVLLNEKERQQLLEDLCLS